MEDPQSEKTQNLKPPQSQKGLVRSYNQQSFSLLLCSERIGILSKSEIMGMVLRQQELLLHECPRCDICGKARFAVNVDRITANHMNIASAAVYELCKGPDTCPHHCTCHLEVPRSLGVSHILHVP